MGITEFLIVRVIFPWAERYLYMKNVKYILLWYFQKKIRISQTFYYFVF